ncbi:MAG: AgmX/PglI C-terminal domain-containing protein [Polyangiaceae bacterium]
MRPLATLARSPLAHSLFALPLALVACGGKEPAPAATPTPAPVATEATTPTATPASEAAADAGSAAPVASVEPPAAAPAVSSAPEAPDFMAEQQAKCAGVAAPYEEKVRAKFNECYQAGKKKNPELAGTIKITLKIDVKGKVTKVVPDPSKLDAKVVACMVQAVKKEPFDGKACLGKDVIVSKKYGN